MPFLHQSWGARAAALGEAVTAVEDAESMSANPAALSAAPGRQVGLTHDEWIQGIEREQLTLLAADHKRTWGVSLQLVRADNLERRTGPTSQPLGQFGAYEGTLQLAAAQSWGKRWRFGANLKVIRQAIFTQTATGLAVDGGALLQLRPKLHLGAGLRNLGAMNALDREATGLPVGARLGIAYYGLGLFGLSAEIRTAVDRSATAHVGVEYTPHPRLVLRSGYQNGDARKVSFGFGLKAGPWALDYAFVPMDFDLGTAHLFSLYLGG